MKRLVCAAVLLVSGMAFAGQKVETDDSKPVQPRVKNVEIEAENLKGELVTPIGDMFVVRRQAEHGSLIRLRADFLPEVVKSAENL